MSHVNPELILKLSGFHFAKAELTLVEIQNLMQTNTEWSSQKKWEIVNHHLAHNKFYRALIGEQQIKSWNDLPVLTKSHFQQPLHELLSDGYLERNLYVANTSGSTGQPFRYAQDKFCHALAWALIKHRYQQYGIDLHSLQARFFGIPLKGRSGRMEQLKDQLMNRIRFPVFDLSKKILSDFLDKFKKYPFEYIYGYTNAIRHFTLFLREQGIVLKSVCPTLKCVIATAEMCGDHDKKIIEQGAGVKCVVEYGSSETGIIGFEAPDSQMYTADELLFLETDAKGSLLITSLFNQAFPMIRYRIGDLVELFHEWHSGRNVIRKITGRSDDLIKLPNGKVAAGLTMYYISRDLLEQMARIKEMYITQTDLSAFKVYYVGEPLNEEEVVLLRKSFDTYLQPGLQLEFIQTNSIRRKGNGKLQIFHSELTA